MNRGFYTIMAAQFFSSLADNALLIAAIALLRDIHAPEWMTPMLKLFFFVSYVVLAAFVGAFADSMPKGRVMFITNLVKITGCTLMFFSVHPLLAYAVVGFGAAAYSPAKYGILTELLPPEKLVVANGWIEGLTVGSIILGFVVGGVLVSPRVAAALLQFDFPVVDFDVDTAGEAAIAVIAGVYAIAAAINLGIPDSGARYPRQPRLPLKLLADFGHCVTTLWRDKLGQISLAVTTLFWGAGATLQFIILKWSEQVLGMSLSQGAIMQAVVAIGIAVGSVWAGARVSLKQSLSVLPVGVAMGLLVASLAFIDFSHVPTNGVGVGALTITYPQMLAGALMVVVGAMAGFFVVPMNALLQHRGYVLLSAGHSIAVQNFNENLSILVMLGGYALLISLKLSIGVIIVGFGLFVAGTMYAVMLRHRYNQRSFDSTALIGQAREHRPGQGSL
jgi:MFS family permease